MPTQHTLPLLHKYNPNLHSGICSASEKIVWEGKGREGSLGKKISLSLGEHKGKKKVVITVLMPPKNKTQLSELPGYLTSHFLCSNKYI